MLRVVSLHSKESNAIVEYDFGKSVHNGQFIRTRSLNKPPNILLSTVNTLKAQRTRKYGLSYRLSKMPEDNLGLAEKFKYQGSSNDRLFQADFIRVEVMQNLLHLRNEHGTQKRPNRLFPCIAYGTISSADQMIKNSIL